MKMTFAIAVSAVFFLAAGGDSIADRLTELDGYRVAITNAIRQKGGDPHGGLNTAASEIMKIPSGIEGPAYPWIGSGTHMWLHFDESSPTNEFFFCPRYRSESGVHPVIDWGDGSPATECAVATSFPGGRPTTYSHVYAHGDYHVTFSGYAEFSYSGQAVGSMFSSAAPLRRPYIGECVVQFESDITELVGNGSAGYTPISACPNLRWISLRRCTRIGNMGIDFTTVGVERLLLPESGVEYVSFQAQKSSLRSFDLSNMASGGLSGNPFYESHELASFVLPRDLSNIPSGMFAYCFRLESVDIPNGVTNIASEAFRQCHSLRSVTIPSSVRSIGTFVFYQCENMDHVRIMATTPPSLGTAQSFDQNSSIKIIVPSGCGDAYKSAPVWSSLSSRIVEAEE